MVTRSTSWQFRRLFSNEYWRFSSGKWIWQEWNRNRQCQWWGTKSKIIQWYGHQGYMYIRFSLILQILHFCSGLQQILFIKIWLSLLLNPIALGFNSPVRTNFSLKFSIISQKYKLISWFNVKTRLVNQSKAVLD